MISSEHETMRTLIFSKSYVQFNTEFFTYSNHKTLQGQSSAQLTRLCRGRASIICTAHDILVVISYSVYSMDNSQFYLTCILTK